MGYGIDVFLFAVVLVAGLGVMDFLYFFDNLGNFGRVELGRYRYVAFGVVRYVVEYERVVSGVARDFVVGVDGVVFGYVEVVRDEVDDGFGGAVVFVEDESVSSGDFMRLLLVVLEEAV